MQKDRRVLKDLKTLKILGTAVHAHTQHYGAYEWRQVLQNVTTASNLNNHLTTMVTLYFLLIHIFPFQAHREAAAPEAGASCFAYTREPQHTHLDQFQAPFPTFLKGTIYIHTHIFEINHSLEYDFLQHVSLKNKKVHCWLFASKRQNGKREQSL